MPKNSWRSSWFWALPMAPATCWSVALSSWSCRCYAFVFSACYWTGLLVTWLQRVESPEETASKQVHDALFLLTLFLPRLPPPLVSELEGRLMSIRTLNKVSFGKKSSSTCMHGYSCVHLCVILMRTSLSTYLKVRRPLLSRVCSPALPCVQGIKLRSEDSNGKHIYLLRHLAGPKV